MCTHPTFVKKSQWVRLTDINPPVSRLILMSFRRNPPIFFCLFLGSCLAVAPLAVSGSFSSPCHHATSSGTPFSRPAAVIATPPPSSSRRYSRLHTPFASLGHISCHTYLSSFAFLQVAFSAITQSSSSSSVAMHGT